MNTPDIVLYVRHAADCKYLGDEFARRCQCRKHIRWSHNGMQHRKAAGTRSWAEAEKVKRTIEAQFTGATEPVAEQRALQGAVDLFLMDKCVQGVSKVAIDKYTRALNRLVSFCEGESVFTVQGLTRELLTEFADTWTEMYPSSVTRSKIREQYRAFLRYCYEAQWIPRIPVMAKIKVDALPTMPLTPAEFERLLAAVTETFATDLARQRTRALFLLMRWSGLAISDAVGLKRSALRLEKGFYRVETKRQKTGTHVSVPIPLHVGEEIIRAAEHPDFIFWSGNGTLANSAHKWGERYVAPVFKKAGLAKTGHMLSHRLRDTFAVDLLEKGVPMEEVSKALGHESIKTTERSYAKWVKGRQDRLDALIAATW